MTKGLIHPNCWRQGAGAAGLEAGLRRQHCEPVPRCCAAGPGGLAGAISTLAAKRRKDLQEMAKSKYSYVKEFEDNDSLLPQTWIVVRIDGHAFTRFSDVHGFTKPNDEAALHLMNDCAKAVLEEISDVVFAFGESDEYSFVVHKASTLYKRRRSKLVSLIVSLFTASYVMKWSLFFPEKKLEYAPSFDGRAVCYPSNAILRDYLSWRQVDCHINNQYNTCFWLLVQSGKSRAEAQAAIKGTFAKDKNELLFNHFNVNYNCLPPIFRKGSAVYRKKAVENSKPIKECKSSPTILATNIVIEHVDIIQDKFWTENPHILGEK